MIILIIYLIKKKLLWLQYLILQMSTQLFIYFKITTIYNVLGINSFSISSLLYTTLFDKT